MAIHCESLKTHQRSELLDVTSRIQMLVGQSGIESGFAVIYVPHTTAAVTINENADPDVKQDMLLKLARMIPKDESGYEHSEGNSDSHVKTALVGNSAMVLIEGG